MRRGKFIVLDGTDGSGKATQLELLAHRLEEEGRKVFTEDFPRYGKKSAGLIEEYLDGVYGSARSVGPYIPSIFYAVDRFAASDGIRERLEKKCVVLCNRYVTANMGHQGSKIRTAGGRDKYYKWLHETEYGFFKIPEPDLQVILYVPPKISSELAKAKWKPGYIRGAKSDIHEKDMGHLKAAARTFREISVKFNYPLIECFNGKRLLTKEEISEIIYKTVKNTL